MLIKNDCRINGIEIKPQNIDDIVKSTKANYKADLSDFDVSSYCKFVVLQLAKFYAYVVHGMLLCNFRSFTKENAFSAFFCYVYFAEL